VKENSDKIYANFLMDVANYRDQIPEYRLEIAASIITSYLTSNLEVPICVANDPKLVRKLSLEPEALAALKPYNSHINQIESKNNLNIVGDPVDEVFTRYRMAIAIGHSLFFFLIEHYINVINIMYVLIC
jgi:hypothetical protein